MNKLRLSALFLAVMFLPSCSYMNDDGTLKSAKSYETVELNNFSFELRDGCKKKDSFLDNTIKLTFKNDIEFYVMSDYDCKVCTPEVLNQDFEQSCLPHDSISTEVLNVAGKEISSIHTADKMGEYDFSKYTYMTDASSFIISSTYEPKDRELFDALAMEIMESLKYIGHSEMSTENEFISVSPENIWFCKSDENSVSCRYACAENMSQYLSDFTIEVMTEGEFDTAEEYAEHEYMKNAEDMEYIQPCEAEFYGKKAYFQKYKENDTDISVYFIDHDGIVYRICTDIYEADGSEDVRDNIDRMLENVTFKPVSAERCNEIKKSSVSDYTSPHFKYSISDFYEAPVEYASQSYFVSSTGNTIEIKEVERRILENHYDFYDYETAQNGGYETIQAGDNTITAVKAFYSSGGGEYTTYVYMDEHNALIISINTDLGDNADIIRKNKCIMDFFTSIESKL